MTTEAEVVFVILSSYSTFQGESYYSRARAEQRLARIAEMDPDGFAIGAYWITSYTL